jgi:hypothetical protein
MRHRPAPLTDESVDPGESDAPHGRPAGAGVASEAVVSRSARPGRSSHVALVSSPSHLRQRLLCIRLFIALGTGGAYAANTIGSADVIDNSLLSRDVHDNALLSADVHDGTLRGDDIAKDTISSSRVLNNSLLSADVQDDTLAGNDVNESTLGQVPNAAHATKAALEGTEVLWKVSSNTSVVEKTKTLTIDCPAGKTAIAGGGYAASSAFTGPSNDDVAITESTPTGTIYQSGPNQGYALATGWTVTARGVEDPWNAGVSVTAWVTCARTDLL